MLTLSCQQQSLVHALMASIQKYLMYNINITVLDPRFKLQWANHAEICAYKTTFAQKIWRNSKLPHTSLHHIQKMTFFSDIFKEQSHGTLEQEINDYLLEQCQLQHIDPLQY